MSTKRPWKVRFYCCGIPSGVITYETWEMADRARNQWLAGMDFYLETYGEHHDRHGILEQNEGDRVTEPLSDEKLAELRLSWPATSKPSDYLDQHMAERMLTLLATIDDLRTRLAEQDALIRDALEATATAQTRLAALKKDFDDTFAAKVIAQNRLAVAEVRAEQSSDALRAAEEALSQLVSADPETRAGLALLHVQRVLYEQRSAALGTEGTAQ